MKSFKSYKILITIGFGLVVVLIGCGAFDNLTQVQSEFPHAQQCGKCHIDIYAEWSQSPHARAFANPRYQQATNDYQFDDCLGCHTPQPLLTRTQPLPRSDFRNEGVTCVSCHLEESGLSGPLEPTGKLAPHPTGTSGAFYLQSDFCGRCHQGTLNEWQAATGPDKQTCQQCHMPGVTRKVTQANSLISKVIVAMEDEVPQKQHIFEVNPQSLSEPPFTVTLDKQDSQLLLTLENHLPHALPTGDFGLRIVRLNLVGIDSDGTEIDLGQHELMKENRTAIPAGASRSWPLPYPADLKSVQVDLVRMGYPQEAPTKIFSKVIPI